MDMARIQPAEAGPTPKPDDLAAYDVILGNARRLTFRMVQHVHQGKVTTFRVDADGTKDAFSILVNHDRARPGENLANNEPFGAFVAAAKYDEHRARKEGVTRDDKYYFHFLDRFKMKRRTGGVGAEANDALDEDE